MIREHLDEKNLHHAYLLEGITEELLVEVREFAKSLSGSEIIEIRTDTFKIEDSRNLKELGAEKSFAQGKKFFIISANSILREAQNAMLKLFEEPIANTHFFVIIPDANSLLKTLVSRFYVISARSCLADGEAEKFIAMPPRERIEFIKELLNEPEAPTPEGVGVPTASVGNDLDSPRAKSLQFLNSLENALHVKISRAPLDTNIFEHIFQVRKYLRLPGSSAKNLLESVALVVPVIPGSEF